ncbi:hypothetical protein ACWEN6_25105 [Sphaerisporangium sp. NPDC004334]
MNIDRTHEVLADLRDALPLLDEALLPGTPRRWAQRDLTDDQRARMDALARAERETKHANLARGLKALGDGRAPLALDVLDTITDITTSTAELEQAVCERLGLTVRAGASTDQRLADLQVLLGRIDEHNDLAEHVNDEGHRMRRQARSALGDTEPVRRVDGYCLHCRCYSLKAFPERGVIVCVNSACRCNDPACRCRTHPRPGTHRWYEPEWKKLAHDLDAAV